MRQFLSVVVPLLLPTALYFLYVMMASRRTAGQNRFQDVPWTWLAVAGGLLVLVTFAGYALFGGAEPGSVYRPPRVIDGRIQPGGFE